MHETDESNTSDAAAAPSNADTPEWGQPLPGPAPADVVTPTVLPPAYRVWSPRRPRGDDAA
jgi:hypothetical protein